MNLRLFDNFIREDASTRKPGESAYHYRNRCASLEYAQMRALLESWYRDYPQPDWESLDEPARSKAQKDRNHLSTSFKAEDVQHEGAFFELYRHAHLHSQGFTVDVQQIVEKPANSPIDFLVRTNGGPFYMEVTVARDPDSKEENAKRTTLDLLWYMLIYKLGSPNFHIGFEIERASYQTPPIKKIHFALEKWLQLLDIDQVSEDIGLRGKAAYPRLIWPIKDGDNGWKFVFQAIPKSPEDCGKPDKRIFSGDVEAWVHDENPLLKALDEKAKKYRNPHRPYVIAVNVLAEQSLVSDDLEVLFGRKIGLVDLQSGQSAWIHAPLLLDRPLEENGLWLSRSGPKHTHVSAVLIVHYLSAGPGYIVRTPVLWHNPWAENPLNPDLWPGPQMIPEQWGTTQTDVRIKLREGKEAREILQLPPEWLRNVTLVHS